jgi:hypothetical protein
VWKNVGILRKSYIDQLDALAELVVESPARLRVLLNLIRDLTEMPAVHIVASCRAFEQRHDPSLKEIDASVLKLELPPWSSVQAVLADRGIATEGWNDELKEVLRSPNALDMFLESLESVSEPTVLTSVHGIFERQWQVHVLSDKSRRRKEAILDIARTMAAREVIGLPLSLIEQWLDEIKQLTAVGLLRFDETTARVEFRHQTLYEFIRARSFLNEAGSLTEVVLRNQASLRVRSQLWHALAYFRTTSPEDYTVELEQLWAAEIRRHLRMLLIEFLGQQVAPLEAELRLVFRSLDDIWFKRRFIPSAIGSSGWLHALADKYLPMWMAQHLGEARQLVPMLDAALKIDQPLTVRLVREFWLSDPSKDELSWRVLAMGSLAPQTIGWVSDLETIIVRTTLADWAVVHAASVVSVSLPEEAPRLVAAWMRRSLAQFEGWSTASGAPTEGDIGKQARNGLRKLHELGKFNEIFAIAQAAPKAFILAVCPVYAEALPLTTDGERAQRNGYRYSYDSTSNLAHDGPILSLLQVMSAAVQEWALAEPYAFAVFVETFWESDLLVIQRLLAQGLQRAAGAIPALALAFLLGDSRRMALGSSSDICKETFNLIQELSRHLSNTQLAELEAYVRNWRYYQNHNDGDDAATRLRRLRYDRQLRLKLLHALPLDKCTSETRRLIDEEERAFPNAHSYDTGVAGATRISSPVSTEQMTKSADEDILNLFAQLPDDYAWDHPKDWMKGGAFQAGQALGALAKKDLRKVLRVIDGLRAATNQIPVATALRELVPAGLSAGDLFSLVEQLDKQGFNGAEFRRNAADAVSNAISSNTLVPDTIVDLMESWLTSVEEGEAEELEESDNHRGDKPILWGEEHMLALPDGNYPILSALSYACLLAEPMKLDRWLAILERHLSRTESLKVWRAMLRQHLVQLRLANMRQATDFLDRLVNSNLALLATNEWVLLVARVYSWVSEGVAQQWVHRIAQEGVNDQGVGELITLRAAIYPEESWPREMIEASLTPGKETVDRRIGIAYAVANLWGAPAARAAVHPYLIALMTSNENKVLQALSSVFLHGSFFPDHETRQFLDKLVSSTDLLLQPGVEYFTEILERLVLVEPERVYKVANAMLDIAGAQMGDISTAWYLNADGLLSISLLLQDLSANHRSAGSALFERMLEFNMPQAQELSLNLDRRTPAQIQSRPRRRRRAAMRPSK